MLYGSFGNNSNSVANATNASSFIWTGGGSTNGHLTDIDVYNPFATRRKFVSAKFYKFDGAGDVGTTTGYNDSTTSYSGFTFTPSAGTITGGTIYVYGYNKG